MIQTDVPEARFDTLSKQAYILEFAANSMLCSYSSSDMGADLWTAHHAAQLVEYHQGLVPEQHADVVETRIMMAQEFERRVQDGRVSAIDHANILHGLLAFEDPSIAEATKEITNALNEGADLREVPGYLSSGNNAAAFVLRNIPGLDGEAVLKIGLPVYHEQSGCDRSALTNLQRWLGLMAGKGVNGFEQPVAFYAEKPVSVSRLAPGVELFEISKLNTKPQPSEYALEQFADAFYESIVRRISIDIDWRDLLYDADTDELTIIDHSASGRAYTRIPSSFAQTVDAIVATFKASFGYEFDQVAFARLLDEFSEQGLHDLRTQIQE